MDERLRSLLHFDVVERNSGGWTAVLDRSRDRERACRERREHDKRAGRLAPGRRLALHPPGDAWSFPVTYPLRAPAVNRRRSTMRTRGEPDAR